jgi:hypothetical protein
MAETKYYRISGRTREAVDQLLAVIEERDAALARVAELERVLAMVEWVYDADTSSAYGEYPWCKHTNLEDDDHAPDCPRQAALRKDAPSPPD